MTHETFPITPGSAIKVVDCGDGAIEVWLEQSTATLIGLGRTRRVALESARTSLQQALNVVDVAIEKGPRT